MDIPIDRIMVGPRKRRHDPEHVTQLANSLRELGLLNPLTVIERDGGYPLVAGHHRLEAAKQLGWATIPAAVLDLDDSGRELGEIDENLIRKQLTLLEEAEGLARKEELLLARGERATRGHGKPAGSAGLRTTADLAAEAGMGERWYQSLVKLGRDVPLEVRDAIRGTRIADDAASLWALVAKPPERQLQIAEAFRADPWLRANPTYATLDAAEQAIPGLFEKCPVCHMALERGWRHCATCSAHTDRDVCNSCAWRPAPPRARSAPPSRESEAFTRAVKLHGVTRFDPAAVAAAVGDTRGRRHLDHLRALAAWMLAVANAVEARGGRGAVDAPSDGGAGAAP